MSQRREVIRLLRRAFHPGIPVVADSRGVGSVPTGITMTLTPMI